MNALGTRNGAALLMTRTIMNRRAVSIGVTVSTAGNGTGGMNHNSS